MTSTDPAREARLAAALRDNLRRRKAQARDVPSPETPQARDVPSSETPQAASSDQKKDDAQAASE